MITAAAGLVLAIAFISIVALAFGLVVASWDTGTPTWLPRILRGTVVTVGITCLLLAALPSLSAIAQALR